MKRLIFFQLSILCLVISNLQAQSGWTRNQGAVFSQLSISTFSSTDYYTVDGLHFDSGNRFRSNALNLYGEYGLTDRLTALGNIPVVKLNSFSSTETVAGLGDLRLGLKYGLLKTFPLSVSIEAEIPTGNGTNFAEAKELNELGFRERINLPVTDGEFNLWTTLAASKSTNSGKTYGSLFGGINWRTEGFSHQFKAGAEIGQRFFDCLWLIGKLQIQESLSEEIKTGVSFLYGEGTTFTSFGLTTIFELNDHWKITAAYSDYSGFITPLRNMYDGPTFSLGLAFELQK